MLERIDQYSAKLPANFIVPQRFIKLLMEHSLTQFKPWQFFVDDLLNFDHYYRELLIHFPAHNWIPLAYKNDNAGKIIIASFDGQDFSGNPLIYQHRYEANSQMWSVIVEGMAEGVAEGMSFTAWLKKALDN